MAIPSAPTAAWTYHTYPEHLRDGGRYARTVWDRAENAAAAIRSTLTFEPNAIVLIAADDNGHIFGLRPGGLSA